MNHPAAERYESWFLERGLPYFVDAIREKVRRRLTTARLLLVLVTALVLWALTTGLLDLVLHDVADAVLFTSVVPLVVIALYGLRALEATRIAGWAIRRTFAGLELLLPLVTRALPMLLLFITFLFINTEVWQVASALRRGVLWGTVLFFTAAAVFFLVTRLDQELDEFDDHVGPTEMLAATEGTSWHEQVSALVADVDEAELRDQAQVTGLQRANLVLALAITQGVQVLLLAVAVFAFFMVFGAVAIDDSVIKAWVGHPATYLGDFRVFSAELTQVSIFLAGFSGLYFTVTAVTDETYRREFFSSVRLELEKAVSVRILYRHHQAAERSDSPGL